MSPKPTPTPEQAAIVERFNELRTGDFLQVQAMAGTGKTTTAVGCAEKRSKEIGLYLAFNRTVALEASQRFPRSTRVRTAHGLAYRALEYRGATPLDRYLPTHLVDNGLIDGEDAEDAVLVRTVLATLDAFVKSVDVEIDERHLPKNDSRKLDRRRRGLILDHVRAVWRSVATGDGDGLPPTFDLLLKIYHVRLARGELRPPPVSWVILDEAQDADPVMLAILDLLPAAQLRIGDPYQQLYRFRGAVDAMDPLIESLPLTGSFRFGSEVAELANRLLARHPRAPSWSLRGLAPTPSRVRHIEPFPPVEAVVCRGNRRAVDSALDLLNARRKVFCESNPREQILFLKSAEALHANRRGDIRHETLQAFASWPDLKDYADETGDTELRSAVSTVENNQVKKRVGDLAELDKRTSPRDQADAVVTTVHKAKGLEWDNTRIADDVISFEELEQGRLNRPEAGQAEFEDEVNIAYVAATRGKRFLATPWRSMAPQSTAGAKSRDLVRPKKSLGPGGSQQSKSRAAKRYTRKD